MTRSNWQTVMKSSGKPRVGFARSPITEGCRHPRSGHTFPDYAVHDELYATTMAVEADGERFALVSLDMGVLTTPPCRDLQKRIAEKTGVRANHLALHCTHTHASYTGYFCDPDVFSSLIARSINEALARLAPAKIAHAEREIGRGYNFNRRIRLSDGLGGWCVMFNTDCRTEGGRVEASGQLEKVVKNWEANWPDLEMSRRENWADGPIDSHVHVVSFRADDGRALGSIVRFAGHPVIVSRAWIGNQIARDAVGCVADLVAEGTGAPCLYLTGPSGNQRLYCEEYSHAEAEKRGTLIGEQAMKLVDALKFSAFDAFGFAYDEPEFDLWPGFPRSLEEHARKLEDLAARVKAAVAQRESPAEIKKLSDEHQRMKFVGQMMTRDLLTLDEAAAGRFRQPMVAFDLGVARLVSFPGEPFMQIGRAVCDALGEEIVTMQLVNGGCGYIPTADEWHAGGYEPTWCSTAPGTDVRMAEEATGLLKSLRPQ